MSKARLVTTAVTVEKRPGSEVMHGAIGHIPPAEHEASYYAQTEPQPPIGAGQPGQPC